MLRHLRNKQSSSGASSLILQQWQQRCCYHSEKGIFGYRPRKQREFKGKLKIFYIKTIGNIIKLYVNIHRGVLLIYVSK